MATTREELEKVISWTKDYLNRAVPNARHQAVVGLSGGIDSAVIAAICVKAVGADKVLGVVMPCDSDPKDENLASDLMISLGINNFIQMDLEETFHRWWYDFRQTMWSEKRLDRMIPANAKARLRMLTLYAAAAWSGGLVIGTTNKTEAILGYATKYGDNGVDIEPLMEFLKCEVYELAALINADSQRTASKDYIPWDIIDRPPSTGLWDGQTDEGELGMKYSEIDNLLGGSFGIDKLCQMADSGLYKEDSDICKIVKLYRANLHKDFHLPHYTRD